MGALQNLVMEMFSFIKYSEASDGETARRFIKSANSCIWRIFCMQGKDMKLLIPQFDALLVFVWGL